jgi:hypothetical protein
MKLTIKIIGADRNIKAEASANESVYLVYNKKYEEGDKICLYSDKKGFVVACLEDSIPDVYGYLTGEYEMLVPFGEKSVSYSPKSFTGDVHLLTARVANNEEVMRYRNLALNPLDCHENIGLFPHAMANVETRGESVFAARNAINGNTANTGHGNWPYESWGINRNPDAKLRIDFGRTVCLDKAVFTTRADFPHDSYWTQATLEFSDGSHEIIKLNKAYKRQVFKILPHMAEWVIIKELVKAEDESPFPALSQIELWGKEDII